MKHCALFFSFNELYGFYLVVEEFIFILFYLKKNELLLLFI